MASTVINKSENEAVTTSNASSFFVSSPSHLNSSLTSEESFIQKLNLQYISNSEINANDSLISLEEQFPMCIEKIQNNPKICVETIGTNTTATGIDSHMTNHETHQEIITDGVLNESNEQNIQTKASQDFKHLRCLKAPDDMGTVKKGKDSVSEPPEMASALFSQETLRKRPSRSQNGSYKRIQTMASKYPRRYKDKSYSKVTIQSSRVPCDNESGDQDVSKDLRFELLPLPTVVKPSPLPCETKDSCYDLNEMFQLPEKKTSSTLKKSSFQTFPICEVIRLVAEALEVPLHHVEELFNETCPLTPPPTFTMLPEKKLSSLLNKEGFQHELENLSTPSAVPETICKQQSTFSSSLSSHTNFLKDEYPITTKIVSQVTHASTNVPYTSASDTFSTNPYISPLPSHPYTTCNKKDKLNNFILSNTRSMKGVSFDRSKRNWEASWLDAQTGKRVKKCFSEGRWGSSARDMAILARRKAEQSGIISTRQQFQTSSNLLTDPETETPTPLSPRITLGKPTTFPLDQNATTQDDLLQQIASRVTKNILLQNKKNTF